MKKYLSTYQVAKILGVNIQTVRHYIRKGELKAARVGKKYIITLEDVDAFLTARKEVRSLEKIGLTEKGRQRVKELKKNALSVLTYLEECPGADVDELSESLGLSRKEVLRALRRLEGKKLVYCEASGEEVDRDHDPWYAASRG